MGFAKRIWDSPTFTSWGSLAAESLRLLAVTPLVLRKFDTTQIAAWYLFGSLLVFGTLVSARVGLTFSRMIAFAMAGATDLSPARAIERRGSGDPNWGMVERVYSTVFTLNLALGAIAVIIASAFGFFALGQLLKGYLHADDVWGAFLFMMLSQGVMLGAGHYDTLLRGMNYVALANRWAVASSLVSILCGGIVLICDGGILALAAAMQLAQLLNVVRLRLLAKRVYKRAVQAIPLFYLDRSVVRWAAVPFWKGLCTSVSGNGIIHIATIAYARSGSADSVAAYALSLRLLQAAARFSEAPLLSYSPKISRLMACGDVAGVRDLCTRKAFQAQALLATTALALGLVVPPVLSLLNSNSAFLSPLHWMLLSAAFIIQKYLLVGLRLPALNNLVICFKGDLSAAIVAGLLIAWVAKTGRLELILAAAFIPQLVILNVRPFRHSASMVRMSVLQFLAESGGWFAPLYILISLAIYTWK